jgi:DNA-directed RNA polymerase specialized sigma24 family protein
MLSMMAHQFAETRWTLVLRAQGQTGEASLALSELCEAYYTPVHRFVCGWCGNAGEARDLTQEFFARLLTKPQIGGAAPEHGKFRSFLLGAVKHFLCDMRDRDARMKRGGGVEHVALDAPGGEGGHAVEAIGIEDVSTPPPDVEFDRQWALHVLERALESLEKAFEEGGKAAHFQALKPWLVSSKISVEEAVAATELGLQDGALRVAVHRLRQRFREQLRREIAQTLAAGADVDLEMQHLLAALRQRGG